MLKVHGWYKPSPTEKSDSKPIESLAASTAKELSTSVGSDDGSTGHRTLEKEIGFSYRKVLGELRPRTWLDVWTLATQSLLVRYSSAPYRCHYLALRRTIDLGNPILATSTV
jgi:hypothetical protein